MSQWCHGCKKWTWWTKFRDGYHCNSCPERIKFEFDEAQKGKKTL